MDQEILQALKKFGLSENEIRVYLETLKKDELSPYQIAKSTGIPRTTVYDVLMSLSLKNLVEIEQSSGLEKQQTRVHGKNPSILRKILKDRRDAATLLEAHIVQVLPALKGEFLKNKSDSNFRYFPGLTGARKVYFELDKLNLEIPVSYWSYLMPLDVFGSEELNKDIIKDTGLRKKYNVKSRNLIPLNDWTRHVLTYQTQLDSNYLAHREFRYIEAPIFEFFLELGIQGDFVRTVCTEEKEVWGLVMRSHFLAVSLMSIYNFMWNLAVPVTADLIRTWGVNKFLQAQLQVNKNFMKKAKEK
ncbi:MAG TPA: helix-turn-helix domain-containing protein [Candidatus Dojkabacteria bacterium]|nr:helix-turn-helix domain-containing protein [Candidatus Dojkabacteria bacterium]